jgi:hypothetical protein
MCLPYDGMVELELPSSLAITLQPVSKRYSR